MSFMRLERLRQVLFSVLVLASWLQAGYSVSAHQRDDNALARVRKIFIESFPTGKRELQTESLTRALKKYGFEVVEDPSEADAILTAEAQAEIVLDGDGSIPDKSIFSYRLALPNKTVIWKQKVKFVSKPNLADDYQYAAKKIAEKMFKDRDRSFKKAARK